MVPRHDRQNQYGYRPHRRGHGQHGGGAFPGFLWVGQGQLHMVLPKTMARQRRRAVPSPPHEDGSRRRPGQA